MEENEGEPKGGGEEKGRWRNKSETDTETKRMRGRKITNREGQSEKGKTFVTLSYMTIGRKNNIINLLTFQYCINLSSGILCAHLSFLRGRTIIIDRTSSGHDLEV